MKTKVGIFGGSFNPIHMGHVLSVHYALSIGQFDKVFVVPCGNHAFEKELVPFFYRMYMCKAAFSDGKRQPQLLTCSEGFETYVFGPNPKVYITDIEDNDEPSYMIDTVVRLKNHMNDIFPNSEKDPDISLILGSDCLAEIDKWKDAEKLKKMVDFFELPREDGGGITPGLSSTSIRYMLSLGQDVSKFVPPRSLAYLEKRQLYPKELL